jgi:hypothetical protein
LGNGAVASADLGRENLLKALLQGNLFDALEILERSDVSPVITLHER